MPKKLSKTAPALGAMLRFPTGRSVVAPKSAPTPTPRKSPLVKGPHFFLLVNGERIPLGNDYKWIARNASEISIATAKQMADEGDVCDGALVHLQAGKGADRIAKDVPD